MKSFDTRTYSISDFAEWNSSGLLVLDPKFQRRSVWSKQAKSYLIDTVVRGKPMPKVIVTQALVDGRNIRTVVDGQQRLRAILEYLAGDFTMLTTHNTEYGRRFYDDLPDDVKSAIWQYEIGVDVLFNTSTEEILDIFARLNTYSVKLNSTEILNAQYLGAFKTTAHTLGHRYADYWSSAHILSQSSIARMGEVELSADLLGFLLEGIKAKKAIPAFYRDYDGEEEGLTVNSAARQFDSTMRFIAEVYNPDDLAQTNFRRSHMFYSLFTAITNRMRVRDFDPRQARVALDDISALLDDYETFALSTKGLPAFQQASARATTDEQSRRIRSAFIEDRLDQREI